MSGETSDDRKAPDQPDPEHSAEIQEPTQSTRVTKREQAREQPLMSFTAVSSHQTMADAFVRELLAIGQKMIPDHNLTIADLATICHMALDRGEDGITMLEGRHLRARVAEQISRAKRYDESFSLLALKFETQPSPHVYDSVVDTLCERMRKSDLMFIFKSRLVLVLPHTPAEACEMLKERIRGLLLAAYAPPPDIDMAGLTYPDPALPGSAAVLDWCEDQLRV